MLPYTHLPTISFLFQVKRFKISNSSALKTFIHSLFVSEGKKYDSLVYIFCSDEYLLNLNKQFLQHNDFTDIITFNLAATGSSVIGECYISINRVKENAKLYHTATYKELLRVIFHGALHLCGYLDKTPGDMSTMRSKEDHYLHLFLGS